MANYIWSFSFFLLQLILQVFWWLTGMFISNMFIWKDIRKTTLEFVVVLNLNKFLTIDFNKQEQVAHALKNFCDSANLQERRNIGKLYTVTFRGHWFPFYGLENRSALYFLQKRVVPTKISLVAIQSRCQQVFGRPNNVSFQYLLAIAPCQPA